MLSYQHGYHAGNFADVIKHLSLQLILDYLCAKEKPLLYLETHAGRGKYRLGDAKSAKTGEYLQGISPVWEKRQTLPPVFSQWIHNIEAHNNKNLLHYPGSPAIAIKTLRSMDRLVFCELHPQEYEALTRIEAAEMRVHFSNSDGLAGLRSFLPPSEKRGVIMIDPSYERKEEYRQIPEALHQACIRFPTGVFILWYPLVHHHLLQRFYSKLKKIPAAQALKVEFHKQPDSETGMPGTGLWIINPPYVLKQQLEEALTTLSSIWKSSACRFSIEAFEGKS